jgi:lambda family phage portal protein
VADPVRYRVKGTRLYVAPVQKATAYAPASRAPRMVRWMPGGVGPNITAFGDLELVRSRSRDLVRENGYAQAGVETLVSNIIGEGITPQFSTPDPAFNKVLAEAFLEWTDEADADGRLDFYGLQALAVRSMIEGGDSFTRFRVRLPGDGLSVPLQLQVLEAEYCPEFQNWPAPAGGNMIRCGIEFATPTTHQRVAYWMTKFHPYDIFLGESLPSQTTFSVPASEVAHLALISRPGQIRGEPWLARAIVKLHDLGKYDDAQLVRQQIAALFAGFRRKDPTETQGDENEALGVTGYSQDGVALAPLEPGTVQDLDVGESIEWSSPPDPGNSYEAFMAQQLRAVAASIGVLYEQVTGNYKDINDRTFRAAVNEFRRRCSMWQHHLVAFQFCRPVLARWAVLAVLWGRVTLPAGITVAMIARAKWVPDGWAYINPTQDVAARREEVRAGFKSRAMVVAADGSSVEQVDAEIAADNIRADGYGLMLDTDPRHTSSAGVTQARADPSQLVSPGSEQ